MIRQYYLQVVVHIYDIDIGRGGFVLLENLRLYWRQTFFIERHLLILLLDDLIVILAGEFHFFFI